MPTASLPAPSAAQSDVPARSALASRPLCRSNEVVEQVVPLSDFAASLRPSSVLGCWRAGLTARHDADRGLLVIEGAATTRARIPADAELGIAWYNRLSRAERIRWHRVSGSAVPADCWRAFQAGRIAP
jgi:hypothetical protein